MPYIANKPGTAFRTFTDKDTFTGDGSTVAFDMQFAMAEAGQNDLQVFVNDVRQIPGDDYTLGVDGSNEYKRVTFTSAPTNGHAIVILNPGTVQGEFSSVADNAITSGKLNVDAITGQVELAEQAADTDTYLIHDASTGSLKKIQAANVTPNETLITGKDALGAGAAIDDLILIYDTSAGVLKKVTQTNLLNFPSISSVSPTSLSSGDGTGNYTIVITGTGFTGATGSFVTTGGAPVSADTSTVDSDTQITLVIAKSSLTEANTPYGVRVTAATGLQSSLTGQIDIDSQPIWSTASGSLGGVFDSARSGVSFTMAAADPESGGDVVYTLESGSLPAGLSGSSTSSGYVISGTATAVVSNTTSNFTIRAADVNSNTSDRAFSITVNAPTVESFTSSGTFSVPSGLTTVDVLVVGGGGAGGYGDQQGGGGGGAGGLIYRPAFSVTPGGTVTVTVGDGSTASNSAGTQVSNGQDTVFGTLTAKGGGSGGAFNTGDAGPNQGSPGGSGGGRAGGYPNNSHGTATQPTQPGDSGTYGFGNPGGQGSNSNADPAGGGGGAGAAGESRQGSPTLGGDGGVGKAYNISGTSVYYAGGGGGGEDAQPAAQGGGTGGNGGGGNGNQQSSGNAQSGTANRGGGGGGGDNQSPGPGLAGSGGKGIVIVSY